jgi:ABC-type phosphate/phosphonate transport system substrate-binding protein
MVNRPCGRVLIASFLAAYLFLPLRAKADEPPKPVQIGVVQSIFRDVPEPMIGVAMKPFSLLMKAQTGLDSELIPPTDTEKLAELLAKKKIQFALFEGVEFAWVKQKYPEFQPLVICVNGRQNRQAFLVVPHDSKVTSFCELEGKEVAIPRRSRLHCYLFVERLARKCGKEPKDFKIKTSSDAGTLLDDLSEGKIQAAVVDRECVEAYHHRKPGRFEKLKELQKSEIFPDSAVVCASGVFDQALVNRFREGLEKPDSTPIGRQLLVLWHLTALQKAPSDYDKILTEIVKSYPPPWESSSKANPARN